MDFKLASRTLILAIASGTFALTSFAQWQWIDKAGRTVFSDRPPPAEIQDRAIVKRPKESAKSTSPSDEATLTGVTPGKPAPTASAAGAKAGAPRLTGKDAELEAKKKKAEDEESAKKKSDEEKIAKTKAENCERAKTGLATLQSGIRIASVNSRGEREILDDVRQAAELKRTQELIDTSCK